MDITGLGLLDPNDNDSFTSSAAASSVLTHQHLASLSSSLGGTY